MPSYHALLSPSSADRWTSCTASIDAQRNTPNTSSDASREGTTCHQILAECLVDTTLDVQTYLGRTMGFWFDIFGNSGEDWIEKLLTDKSAFSNFVQHEVEVTQEHIEAVVSVLNYVRQIHELKGGMLEVEQRVPIGFFTGEDGGGGTSDVTLVGDDWIHVIDAKFGRSIVMAYEVMQEAGADMITGVAMPAVLRANLQMACYALGSIEKFSDFGDFKHVTMSIAQPFPNHVSEYSCTVAELREVEQFLRVKAEETRRKPVFKPTPDNCHFCRASGSCKAQTEAVLSAAIDGFDDVETAQPKAIKEHAIGSLYAIVPMVEDWCKAVAERVRQVLASGQPVYRDDGLRYKFVAGKRGRRAWVNPAEAAAVMTKMRLLKEQMYEQSLISPATAEKLTKAPRVKKGEPPIEPILGPTQWNRLQKYMRQPDGRPTVVLETDPRPEVATTDGFDDVPTADENSDLF